MNSEQKSTTLHQQARQRQMTKIGETWHLADAHQGPQPVEPVRQSRCVFASVNGYAQAEVVTTVRKRD